MRIIITKIAPTIEQIPHHVEMIDRTSSIRKFIKSIIISRLIGV